MSNKWTTSTAALARHLAKNTHIIARHPHASQLHTYITQLIHTIEHTINRPPPPRFCGQCDTTTPTGHLCGHALYAPREHTETTCPHCHTTHHIDQLYQRTLDAAEHLAFTRETLIGNQRTHDAELYSEGLMGELDEFVHWQAFNRWVRERKLLPVMWLQPNGQHTHTPSPGARPEYRLGDLRYLRRTTKHQNDKTTSL